ncbi:MAG TPA: Ig-like domain-containing protein [Gemmatimonadales bacterium]|nr:Ig-like domain-containing protein [Gemmatimonadales bacterium]
MKSRTRSALRLVGLACLAGVVYSCSDSQSPFLRDTGGPTFAVVDGANNGGNPDVFFHPPLVTEPSGSTNYGDRPANPNLQVFARVCQLNATEAVPFPDPLQCVATLGDIAMAFSLTNQLYQANLKDGGFTLNNDVMYRIDVIVGTKSLAFRDIDPDENPSVSSCSGNVPYCQFNNGGSGSLPIKVRIESGALCPATLEDPTVPCASASLPVGGTVALEDGGEVISEVEVAQESPAPPSAMQSSSSGGIVTTVTLSPCHPATAISGLVDLPTFGECVDVVSDPPFTTLSGVVGVATLCQALETGLSAAQAMRVSILNLRADGFVYALPDAEGEDCVPSSPTQQGMGPRAFDQFIRVAKRSWETLQERVLALLMPQPAMACDVGCGGWDVESPVQAALPAKMGYDASNPTGYLGSGPGGRTVSAALNVTDAGGDAVAGVTLSASANGGSVSPATAQTGTSGNLTFSWTLPNVPGTYTLTVAGRGVADPTCGADCGPEGVYAPRHSDGPTADAIQLGVGELKFTAVVCEPGFGTPQAIDGTISNGEWGCALQRSDVRVNLSGGSSTFATLRWMNDETNFYLALEVPGTARENSLRIEWSNDANLSGGRALGDDVWEFSPSAGKFDKFVDTGCVGSGQSSCGFNDAVGGGGNQTTAAFNNTAGGKTVYEMKHPLNTGDVCTVTGNKACGSTIGYSIDLPAQIGQTKGFFLTLRLGSGAQGNTQWPGFLNYLPITIKAPPPAP